MNLLNSQAMTRLSGDLKMTSNGTRSKTVKVTITARSGDPVNLPGYGPVVHDFSGMTSKNRIPLDLNHDQDDSIGYLNNFDTSTGDLICSGAVVLTDPDNPDNETTDLVTKILAGVPYEASIQTDGDMTLQFVPEGVSVVVNGGMVAGPVTVVTDWTLTAVAICKFGADPDTSTDITLSKTKTEESAKGFFVRIQKNQKGINLMTETKTEVVAAVEAPVEVVKTVEADVKAIEVATELSEVKVEAAADPVAAVEAEVKKTEEAPVAEVATVLSKSVDPREEFKAFVTAFGSDKASTYFMEGLSYSDALTQFSAAIKAENEDLKKRLSAVDRGATSPVRFSKVDSEGAKGSRTAKPAGQGPASVIRLANK
jgi:hypothetical protein